MIRGSTVVLVALLWGAAAPLSATAKSAAVPRLSPLLQQLYASRFAADFRGERSGSDALVVDGDAVDVVIECPRGGAGEVATAAATRGARVAAIHGDLVFARVAIAELPRLAASPGLLRVRTPYRAEPDVVSEALALHGATAAHAAHVGGRGARVGILDCGGFAGYDELLGTELPAAVTLWTGGSDPVGASDHGTACAEIAFDVAPEARFYLAHDETEADFYAAIDWLVAQQVDVISYSCSWREGFPHDGAGLPYDPVNAKVEEARAAGVLFFASAGNAGDRDHYHSTYQPFEATSWHSFEGSWSNRFYAAAGSTHSLVLVWNDWPVDPATSGASRDYALELWRWTGTEWLVVAASDNPQEGAPGQLPVEEIAYAPAVSDWHYLTLSRIAGGPADFLVLDKSSPGAFEHWVAASSLGSPAGSPAATTVGAVHWNGWGAEPFSSRGPTLGPGGEPTGGALKPDLAAADAVSTVTYGASDGAAWPDGSGFFGTSAACPHAAGVAALLAGVYSAADADAIEARLLAQAIDQGDPGADTTYGHGLVFLADQFLFVDGFEAGDLLAWDGATGGG